MLRRHGGLALVLVRAACLGRNATAAAMPAPMSVPPPPTSCTWRAEVTRWAGATAVSQASTRTCRASPRARSRPSTSASAAASRASVMLPEVSHTTATSGTGRRNAGSTTGPDTAERRDGRR
jgi:hypothetical protein